MTKNLRSFAISVGAAILMMLVFPPSSAVAHDSAPNNATAKEAATDNNMATMQSFVLHARAHMDVDVKKSGAHGAVLFFRSLGKAPWKYENTYVIVVEQEGGTVRTHAKNNNKLFGTQLDMVDPVVKSVRDKAAAATAGTAACEQYGAMNKWVCGAQWAGPDGKVLVFIAGFDHDEDDSKIVPIQCPEHETPTTTAADVEKMKDMDTLKKFVEEAARVFRQGFMNPKVGLRVLNCFYVDPNLQNIKTGGSIYVYIMTSGEFATTVFVNPNNPDLRGDSFVDYYDKDFVDISRAITETASADGKGGFIRYRWDDPSVMGDEVARAGEEAVGKNFNEALGTSPKIAYVLGVDLGAAGIDKTHYIVGSGYYPKEMMDDKPMMATDSDSGCAIAGAGGNSGSSAFGLFLAVFSICFVIGIRSRRT